MTEVNYGTINLPDKIDITDPCYNKDVWCRINNFPITAGVYECYTVEADNDETGGWGTRIARIGIRKDIADNYEEKGSIGVDAGLAGFFNNTPDSDDEAWIKICDMVNGKDVILTENSFFSSSGYGDGMYYVTAGYKNGQIVEVFIDFITDEDIYGDEDE